MELTYDKTVDTLDFKHIAGSTISYSLQTGIYENSGNNLMIKSLFSNKLKVKITIDDIS